MKHKNMKHIELKNLIREEIRRVLREDYLKQNNLYIDEFGELSPADYKMLNSLIEKFDEMQDANDALFDFTGDIIDPQSFDDIAGYELFYSTVAKEGKRKFPKAADLASKITAILQKAWKK